MVTVLTRRRGRGVRLSLSVTVRRAGFGIHSPGPRPGSGRPLKFATRQQPGAGGSAAPPVENAANFKKVQYCARLMRVPLAAAAAGRLSRLVAELWRVPPSAQWPAHPRVPGVYIGPPCGGSGCALPLAVAHSGPYDRAA